MNSGRSVVLRHIGFDLLVGTSAVLCLRWSTGAFLWLLLGALGWSVVRLAADCTALRGDTNRRGLLRRPGFGRFATTIVATFATLITVEAALRWSRSMQTPGARTAHAKTSLAATIPQEWSHRPAEVPGAVKAYWWHGKLHVQNRMRMRQIGSFPPRDPQRARILVIGDSLTYGLGVAAEEAYPSLLQSLLLQEYRVEVLNLGVSGDQSEDIRNTLQRMAEKLGPTLIVYGVCVNDYLPSRLRQNLAPAPTLARADLLRRWFRKHLLVVGFTLDRWAAARIALGIDDDLQENILHDFEARERRFRGDVKAMNELAQSLTGHPLVTIVLQHITRNQEQARTLFECTQRNLRDLATDLCPMDEFLARHHDDDLRVSQWEAHPNTEAHREFAEELARHLRGDQALEPYRIE